MSVLIIFAMPKTRAKKVLPCLQYTITDTENMVLLRQQNKGQQIKFLLLQKKNSPQQRNVLLIELNILLL